MTRSGADFSLRAAARQLVSAEGRQYAAVLDWVRRRDDVVDEAARALPYAALAGPMIWLFVLASAAEVVVVHVLLSGLPVLRWIVLVLGVWSLVWMIGFLASYRCRPHVLTGDRLRVRAGVFVDVVVPIGSIAGVTARERDLSSATRLTELVDDGGERGCAVGVSGRTNLQLALSTPLRIDDPRWGRSGEVVVHRVGLWVDDVHDARRSITHAIDRADDVRRGGPTA